MANGKIRFGKQSGGVLSLTFPDGVTNTELVLPESGELVNKEYADLKQSKSELSYNVDTSSYIPNTLSSGAIIERGSNANGQYVKYADGTLICLMIKLLVGGVNSGTTITFPHNFIDTSYQETWSIVSQGGNFTNTYSLSGTGNRTLTSFIIVKSTAYEQANANIVIIGRWK